MLSRREKLLCSSLHVSFCGYLTNFAIVINKGHQKLNIQLSSILFSA